MKNISRWIVISVLFYGLVLAGCDKRNDVERDDVSFEALNSEEILGESSDYQNLRALMGNLTYKELLTLLDGSLKKLNALQAQGYTTSADYQTLYNILNNMYTMMLEDQAAYEKDPSEGVAMSEASQALSDLVTMAAENHVGSLLNQVIQQTGPKVLTKNVYPMLAYALAADDELLEGAVGGLTIGSLDYTNDFVPLLGVVHNALDPDGDYADLHESLSDLMDALKGNALELDGEVVTVGDLKELLGLDETDTEEDAFDEALLDALIDVFDEVKDDTAIRQDLNDILYSAGWMMQDADFGRILDALDPILALNDNPDPAQNTLAKYLRKALIAIAPTSDGETLKGLIDGIAGINPVYLGGIDDGLISVLQGNMYGQQRGAAGVDVQTSSMRALMFMMQEANFSPSLLGIPELSLVSSPDHPTGEAGTVSGVTTNIAEWTVGEVANAIRWGREGVLPGVGYADPMQSLDWLLYEKQYKMLGLMTYTGMVGMMTDTMVKALMPAGVVDPFPAFVELLGGKADVEGTTDAYTNRAGHPGERHTLFALFAPLMEYFWTTHKGGGPAGAQDMIMMMVYLNEIPSDAYVSLSNANATFKLDNAGTVFKTIEGTNGSGLLTCALKAHGASGGEQIGVLDPTLDLLVRVIQELQAQPAPDEYVTNHPGFSGNLFDALMAELDLQGFQTSDGSVDTAAIDDLVNTLFEIKDGESENVVARLRTIIYDNHADLVNLGNAAGKIMVALGAFELGDDESLLAGIDRFLDADTRGNIVALCAATGNILPDILDDEDNDIQQATLDLLVTSLNNMSFVLRDVKTVLPILDRVVDIDDTQADSTLADLIDYLTAETAEGGDNAFMANALTLGYKVLDIQNDTYNPSGYITDTTPLTGPDSALTHLLGSNSLVDEALALVGVDNGLYDLGPLMDFLLAATGEPDILWTAMEDGGDMLDRIMGDESLSLSFVRSLVTELDYDGDSVIESSVLADIIGLVNLEQAMDDEEFMDRVLNDVAQLLTPKDPDEDPLAPGGETFKMLLKVLGFVLNNTTVK